MKLTKAIICCVVITFFNLSVFAQSLPAIKEFGSLIEERWKYPSTEKWVYPFSIAPTPKTTAFATKIANNNWPIKDKLEAIDKFRKSNPKMGLPEMMILKKLELELEKQERAKITREHAQKLKQKLEEDENLARKDTIKKFRDILINKKIIPEETLLSDFEKIVIEGETFKKREVAGKKIEDYVGDDLFSKLPLLDYAGSYKKKVKPNVEFAYYSETDKKHYTWATIDKKNYIHKWTLYKCINIDTNFDQYDGKYGRWIFEITYKSANGEETVIKGTSDKMYFVEAYGLDKEDAEYTARAGEYRWSEEDIEYAKDIAKSKLNELLKDESCYYLTTHNIWSYKSRLSYLL